MRQVSECRLILRKVYVRFHQPEIQKHLRYSFAKNIPEIERSHCNLPDFAYSGCLNTTLSSPRRHHTLCILRPVFGTPMAWHNWHLAISLAFYDVHRPPRGPQALRSHSNIRIIATIPELFAFVRSIFEILIQIFSAARSLPSDVHGVISLHV